MLVKIICLVVILSNSINYRVQCEILGVTDGFEEMLKFWYPDDADFDESCVSEGCPVLKNFSLCPNQINISVLLDVLNSAKGCMREPICGMVIDRRPTLVQTTTIDEWLPEMEIDGTATSLPGTGFLHNISNIAFELLPSHNQTHQLPHRITMFISNLRMLGSFHMELRFRKLLPSILGQALSVSIPQAKYDVELEFISTMSINHSATHSNFEIKLVNPVIKSRPMFCGLDMPEGFPSILTSFTSMTQIIMEKSTWAVRKAAFLEKYFLSVIRSITKRC